MSAPGSKSVGAYQEALAGQAVIGQRFGAFTGVFTPTLLTILGVIMYLREGWVIGNAGLLGGLLVILLAVLITTCTGLAMSSITTNIRIGAGGAFSIISQSLGLEVGGSIGVPLYLAQALAVAMYIFGFREGYQWIFPNHPALAVDVTTFLVLLALGAFSAGLAFRIQYVIMGVIACSLISVAVAAAQGSMQYPVQWWGQFPGSPENNFSGVGFFTVFAVFFPAATGIMAGANMSGELKDPRRSIPVGTMSAIALSSVVYIALAYWLARSATPEELVSNYTILIDRAAWRPIVLAGLLGATFSSALASLVGAPRILAALGEHRILPGSSWFARRNGRGEPMNAMLTTAALVLAALLLRDLNVIAPLLSMFFLITYGMINIVVLIEQMLGLVSFRPTFAISAIVPLLGAAGCIFAMFIQNPAFSLVAVVFILIIYGVLIQRRLQAPFGDVRSGLFGALAEWGARKAASMAGSSERTWQPNLVVPVESPYELRGSFRFIYALARPKGSIKILGLTTSGEGERLRARLPLLTGTFRRQGIFASFAIMDAAEFAQGVVGGMQALKGSILTPNLVFLTAPRDHNREAGALQIISKARENSLGALLFAQHAAAGLGLEKSINVWVKPSSPDWPISMRMGNLDLMLLLAYLLRRNWGAELALLTTIESEDHRPAATGYLTRLTELVRLPSSTRIEVIHGQFPSCAADAPAADLHIFGMPPGNDFAYMRALVESTRASCAFVLASGSESALA